MKNDNILESILCEKSLGLPKYSPYERIILSESGEVINEEYEPGFLEATQKSQDFIDETILKQHEELNKKGE